jgi:hypothetical protein
MGGAFQASRDIFSHPIWQDIPKFRIFFYIVGNAVFSKEGYRVDQVKVGRGQYLRSYRNLRDDLEYIENRSIKKYSLSLIDRKIKQLVKEERLKIESTELGTLFTVVNYAVYQGLDNYKKTNENGERTQREQKQNSDGTQREQKQNNNKNVEECKRKERRKRVYDTNSDPFQLALRLFTRIKENNPDHREPNLHKWADDMRLLVEKDKKDPGKIANLIDWVQNDDFEQTNVLSAAKLRKRYDQLVMKARREYKQQKGVNEPKSNLEHFDINNLYGEG